MQYTTEGPGRAIHNYSYSHKSLQQFLPLFHVYLNNNRTTTTGTTTSSFLSTGIVFGSRPSDHYFRSVCLCLFVCAEFFSAVFDPIWIKLGHMLHVRV